MIFHTEVRQVEGFAAAGKKTEKYELNPLRLAFGALFLLILLGLSFLAHYLNWPDGSAAILHMAEIASGGIIGVIFGEREAGKHA